MRPGWVGSPSEHTVTMVELATCVWWRWCDCVASQLGRHDLSFFSFFPSQHNVWLIFPTLKLNHMISVLGNRQGSLFRHKMKFMRQEQTQAVRTLPQRNQSGLCGHTSRPPYIPCGFVSFTFSPDDDKVTTSAWHLIYCMYYCIYEVASVTVALSLGDIDHQSANRNPQNMWGRLPMQVLITPRKGGGRSPLTLTQLLKSITSIWEILMSKSIRNDRLAAQRWSNSSNHRPKSTQLYETVKRRKTADFLLHWRVKNGNYQTTWSCNVMSWFSSSFQSQLKLCVTNKVW